ncbi:MAG: hypothetical protein KatS3mg131_0983 [Candidatus Tectimicrobiota bacterium]|nr:MAG: hypothetical protein KatS3mg131_0983 [Candidatus Tectomicrobia bacterium]
MRSCATQAWEATFALDFLRHLEGEKLLLFHTPPAGVFEGEAEPGGHEAVSHLIKTYDPRFAFCSRQGGQKGRLLVGNTLVVCPGQLRQGDYAILDTRERRVAFGDLR